MPDSIFDKSPNEIVALIQDDLQEVRVLVHTAGSLAGSRKQNDMNERNAKMEYASAISDRIIDCVRVLAIRAKGV